MELLELHGVSKQFARPAGGPPLVAVDNVDLVVHSGESVAIIGESGSGKSTLARLALGLIDCTSGLAMFEGTVISGLPRGHRRALRARMTAVFQEPLDSLNPRMRVARIVEEPLVIHRRGDRRERAQRANAALDQVGLGGAFAAKYPAELSGGQQQRVSLARAIVTEPRLIILDEPTSSLDLSVQAQVLDLLVSLRERLGMAYLFITHDIAVAEFISSRVAVMYRGKIVEAGPSTQVLSSARHDYTRRLLSSVLEIRPEPFRGQ